MLWIKTYTEKANWIVFTMRRLLEEMSSLQSEKSSYIKNSYRVSNPTSIFNTIIYVYLLLQFCIKQQHAYYTLSDPKKYFKNVV